jgi:hypothetical protein
MHRPLQRLLATLILSIAAATPAMAADNNTHPAAQAVLDFNHAITTRNMQTGWPLLAKGAVQFNLHPVHAGMGEDPPLTEDLLALWTTVTTLLFATTEAYARHPEITDVQTNGELATVWTQTQTSTIRKGKEPNVRKFSELYFLINKDDSGWRIAGTATNRPVDNISVAK